MYPLSGHRSLETRLERVYHSPHSVVFSGALERIDSRLDS